MKQECNVLRVHIADATDKEVRTFGYQYEQELGSLEYSSSLYVLSPVWGNEWKA
jgi:hypothetical protein